MTYSHPEKMLTQLKNKPAKIKKWKKHNTWKIRPHGRNLLRCVRCGRTGSHISSYELHLCRQCFREIAPEIGFKKYS